MYMHVYVISRDACYIYDPYLIYSNEITGARNMFKHIKRTDALWGIVTSQKPLRSLFNYSFTEPKSNYAYRHVSSSGTKIDII